MSFNNKNKKKIVIKFIFQFKTFYQKSWMSTSKTSSRFQPKSNKAISSNFATKKTIKFSSKIKPSGSPFFKSKRSFIEAIGSFEVNRVLFSYSFSKEMLLEKYRRKINEAKYKFRPSKATYYEKIRNLRNPKDYLNIEHYMKTYDKRIQVRKNLQRRRKRFRKWFVRYFVKNFKNYFSSSVKQKSRLMAAFKVFYFYKKLVRLQCLPRRVQRKRKFKRLSKRFLKNYKIFVNKTLRAVAPKLFNTRSISIRAIFKARKWQFRSALARIRTVYQKRRLNKIFNFSIFSNEYFYTKKKASPLPLHVLKQSNFPSIDNISSQFSIVSPNEVFTPIGNSFKLFNFKNFRNSVSKDITNSPVLSVSTFNSSNFSDVSFRRFPKHKLAFFNSIKTNSRTLHFTRTNKYSLITVKSTVRNPKRYNRRSHFRRVFSRFRLFFKKRVPKIIESTNLPFFIRSKTIKHYPFLGLFAKYRKFNYQFRTKRNKFFLFFRKYFRLYDIVTGKKSKDFKKIFRTYSKVPFYLHIFKSTNNIFINLSAPRGRSLYVYSAGRTGYRGSKRLSPPALETIGKNVSQIFKNSSISAVNIVFHSPLDTITRSLLRGLNINVSFKSFSYYLNSPHNGLKKRAKRRV